MVRIVNLKHEPDAVADGAVRVDRRTKFGNPFVIGRDGTREQVVARYRAELWRQIRDGEMPLADLAALAGRPLACHCWPTRPCHAEVLALAAAWAAAALARNRRSRSTPMGRYRTDLTFALTAPDEVRIYRDNEYIGDIYRDEDILEPGRFHFIIWLAEDWRGWKRVTERSQLRAATERWVETHPFYG